MRITIVDQKIGLLNSVTRIPFRYGKACLTRCPQLMLQLQTQHDGRKAIGTAADCLPPGWFDKRPGRDFRTQVEQMLDLIRFTGDCFAYAFGNPAEFFPTWLDVYQQVQTEAETRDATPLLASFAVSLFERALLDASCRAAGLSFGDALRGNLWSIDYSAIHPPLTSAAPADWLPASPRQRVFVRHTVGLSDPLTSADLAEADSRPQDGLPVSLEDYLQDSGLRFLKIKVSNCLEDDLERLCTIAQLTEAVRGDDYRITLDGNEQYANMAELMALVDSIQTRRELQTLWRNTLLIEQPLERDAAMNSGITDSMNDLARLKPVIIDESDGRLSSFAEAAEVGYRGTSMKNCKGPIKAIANYGLIEFFNRQSRRDEYVMTAEDLCSVGVVAVQADLCLAASLGIEHVERNGHHFHSGLSYLPTNVQQEALHDHPDFYAQHANYVGPNIQHGEFHIASLQVPGFGFRSVPDISCFTSLEQWTFDSLGIET